MLLRNGWIELVRTAKRRGATEHYYRTTQAQVIEDEEWGRIPSQLRHSIVLGMQDIANREAHAAALHGGFDWAHAHFSRSLVDLDQQGVEEVAAALRDVITQLEAIAASARERDSSERERHEVVIQFFRVVAED